MSATASAIRTTGRTQLVRYAVVGVASNLLLYLLYLLITSLGMEPKAAMTCTFAVGVMQTFWANKAWTFSFDGASTPAFARYVLLYLAGYVVNLLLLLAFVDWLGLPHVLVQAASIFLVAALIFLGQRCWVFSDRPRN